MLNKVKTKGFTMLEVLVAIFVITVGVLAAFNVVQNLTTYSKVTSSTLTATYLAQEGIELIRNKRDSNWLQKSSWDNIDVLSIGCARTSIFGKFNRTCTYSTSTVGTTTKMKVSVGASWQERGAPHSVTSTTELYKWF